MMIRIVGSDGVALWPRERAARSSVLNGHEMVRVQSVPISALSRINKYLGENPTDPVPARPLESGDPVFERLRGTLSMDDPGDFFATMMTAKHLCLGGLFDLFCARFALEIKDKTPRQIRERFGIDELSEEDMDLLKEKNGWILLVKSC